MVIVVERQEEGVSLALCDSLSESSVPPSLRPSLTLVSTPASNNARHTST